MTADGQGGGVLTTADGQGVGVEAGRVEAAASSGGQCGVVVVLSLAVAASCVASPVCGGLTGRRGGRRGVDRAVQVRWREAEDMEATRISGGREASRLRAMQSVSLLSG